METTGSREDKASEGEKKANETSMPVESHIDKKAARKTKQSKAVFVSGSLSAGLPDTFSWINDFNRTYQDLTKPLSAVMALQKSMEISDRAATLFNTTSPAFKVPTALSIAQSNMFNSGVFESAVAAAKMPGHLQWLNGRGLLEANTILQGSMLNKSLWQYIPAQINSVLKASDLISANGTLRAFDIYKTEGLCYLKTNNVTKSFLESMTMLSGVSYLHVNNRFELAASNSLSVLNYDNFYTRLGVNGVIKAQLTASTVDLSLGYSQISTQVIGSKIDRFFYDLTAKDYFLKTQVAEVFSRANSVTNEKRELVKGIVEASTEYITINLQEVEPALLNMWQGAIYIMNSDSPDSARQFSTSLRELFNHALLLLAPKNNVLAWLGDAPKKEYLTPDKQITRKAMFDYICRDAVTSNTERYISSNRDMVLSLVSATNGGTHELDGRFSADEMYVIKAQAQSTLLFLLAMAKKFNA